MVGDFCNVMLMFSNGASTMLEPSGFLKIPVKFWVVLTANTWYFPGADKSILQVEVKPVAPIVITSALAEYSFLHVATLQAITMVSLTSKPVGTLIVPDSGNACGAGQATSPKASIEQTDSNLLFNIFSPRALLYAFNRHSNVTEFYFTPIAARSSNMRQSSRRNRTAFKSQETGKISSSSATYFVSALINSSRRAVKAICTSNSSL